MFCNHSIHNNLHSHWH